MDLTSEVAQLKELLAKLAGKDILILLNETANRDMMAAALGLCLSLREESDNADLKYQVKVAYPKPPTVAWNQLVGIQKVIQTITKKNFIITLDYVEGAIEKVSYNIEGNKFNLVIEPKAQSQDLFTEKNVHYNYGGVDAGLIITVGVPTLESLGAFYSENQKLFTEKPIISISHMVGATPFGKINFMRPLSSCSEIVVHTLKAAGLPITADAASNLYDGLISGSRNFAAASVNADTFEVAATLLRSGARKPAVPFTRSPEELPRAEFATGNMPEPTLPPDWLKPKVFKSSQNPPFGSGGNGPSLL